MLLFLNQTRQEAQSILNQIAQSRNSLKDQETTSSIPVPTSSANVEMELGNPDNVPSSNRTQSNVQQKTSSTIGLSSSLIVLENSDNPNLNDTNVSISNVQTNEPKNSNPNEPTNQDTDSESEHFFSNFNIKKRTLN